MANDLEGASRAAEYSTKAVSDLVEILSKIAGPPAEEVGELLRAEVRYVRIARLQTLASKVKALLAESEREVHPVSLKFLAPFLEHASLEDNEKLSDQWANLLASAATTKGERVAYVRILAELEPLDAEVLDRLCRGARLRTFKESATASRWCKELGVTEHSLRLAFANLRRLGLVWIDEHAELDGAPIDTEWKPTELGRDFWYGCQGRPMSMAITKSGPD